MDAKKKDSRIKIKSQEVKPPKIEFAKKNKNVKEATVVAQTTEQNQTAPIVAQTNATSNTISNTTSNTTSNATSNATSNSTAQVSVNTTKQSLNDIKINNTLSDRIAASRQLISTKPKTSIAQDDDKKEKTKEEKEKEKDEKLKELEKMKDEIDKKKEEAEKSEKMKKKLEDIRKINDDVAD